MFRRVARIGSALVALSFVTGACGSSGNVDRERQALLTLDREWSQQNKDMDKFMSKWAPEASLHLPGMPIATGQDRIRKAVDSFVSPGFSMSWSPAKADAAESGDIGYTSGTYRVTRNDAAGNPATETGKYVEVWKKDSGGNWKVVEFIFNGDAPPK